MMLELISHCFVSKNKIINMTENKIKTESNHQNLSSTTLFNFTDTFDHLVSNLENGFYCGELYEKLPIDSTVAGYKAAMVCFCDIPLGQIKEHLGWYGNFAIGIRRDYARKHGVNPVWYIHSDNLALKKMFSTKDKSELQESPILPYLKRFLGKQKDVSGRNRMKKFYDEREWRYVSQNAELKPKIILGGNHIDNAKEVEDTKNFTNMPRNLDAIEYIIVNNQENKEELYKVLKKLSDKHNVSYEGLISSILTCNQIRKDF